MWVILVQRLALEFLLDILYFPLWWFSGGVKKAGGFCIGILSTANGYLAPGLWLKNIAVPMFGQYDWQGRLISIFMRLVNVVGRSIALFFVLIFILALLLIWLVFPIVVVMMLAIAFFGLS